MTELVTLLGLAHDRAVSMGRPCARARRRSTKDCFGGKGGAGDGLERHVCARGEDEILLSRRRALSEFRCRARAPFTLCCASWGSKGTHRRMVRSAPLGTTPHNNCDEYVFAKVL